ncbi:MAG: hypothetical protein ACRDXF_00620, partial [Acidimicrobiia bacterium]
PGGGSAAGRPGRTAARARVSASRRWFYLSVAVLALSALAIAMLAVGEPWNLAPGMATSFAKSVAALLITLVLVLPAFAVFRYERQSVGGRWHEPAWRPSLIGWVGLLVSLGLAIGWHGLRLAFYIARVWTGEL